MSELSSISVKYLLVVLVLFRAAGLSTSNGNDCSSKPETGPCRGYFPKFYFDPSDKTCKRFIYGGCRGNGNRYATKDDCLEACADCSSKPETGLCRGHFPSFYFDPSDKTCKRFIYGGCLGNGNRYATKDDCLEACGDCSSKPETGPCRGHFPSFYFDPSDKTCKRFIYGGCRGNGNRYATKEACQEACGGNDCSSRPSTGPCRGYFPSFYFDPSDKTCKRFIYGGCRGNGNRYATKDDCQKACQKVSNRA